MIGIVLLFLQVLNGILGMTLGVIAGAIIGGIACVVIAKKVKNPGTFYISMLSIFVGGGIIGYVHLRNSFLAIGISKLASDPFAVSAWVGFSISMCFISLLGWLM